MKEKEIKKIVKDKLSCAAHQIDHVERVYNNCLKLAKGENIDLEVLKLAALLHDIARVEEDKDHSGKTDHALLGAKQAEAILKDFGFPENKIEKIKECIISHRSKSGNHPKTKEAKILFDADKLDVIGAIGIARAFVWVGKNNANIYREADIKEYTQKNLKEGRIKDPTKHSPQIEFKLKTKFIKEKMYTKKGKKLAEERVEFYKKFLERLEKEIKEIK